MVRTPGSWDTKELVPTAVNSGNVGADASCSTPNIAEITTTTTMEQPAPTFSGSPTVGDEKLQNEEIPPNCTTTTFSTRESSLPTVDANFTDINEKNDKNVLEQAPISIGVITEIPIDQGKQLDEQEQGNEPKNSESVPSNNESLVAPKECVISNPEFHQIAKEEEGNRDSEPEQICEIVPEQDAIDFSVGSTESNNEKTLDTIPSTSTDSCNTIVECSETVPSPSSDSCSSINSVKNSQTNNPSKEASAYVRLAMPKFKNPLLKKVASSTDVGKKQGVYCSFYF